MFNSAPKNIWILVFFVTLGKLLYLLCFNPGVVVFEVGDIAKNIYLSGKFEYQHNGTTHFNYQFPVYPFFVYCLMAMFGPSWLSIQIANIILLSVSAIFLYGLLNSVVERLKFQKPFVSESIVFITIATFLLNPLFVYYSIVNIHPLCFDTFLFLWCLHYCFRVKSKKKMLFVSVLIGLTVLERPTFLVLLFVPLLNFYSAKRIEFWLPVVSTLIVVNLWMYRNYLVSGSYSLSSTFAQNLWIGIQEKTSGTAYVSTGENYLSLLSEEEKKLINGMNSKQQSNFFLDKYRSEIRQRPILLFKMYLVKIKSFWTYSSHIGYSYSNKFLGFVDIYKILQVCVFVFFLFGVLSIPQAWWFWSIPIFFSFVQALFYFETRHRLPLEPIIIFTSLIGLINVFDYLKTMIKRV